MFGRKKDDEVDAMSVRGQGAGEVQHDSLGAAASCE